MVELSSDHVMSSGFGEKWHLMTGPLDAPSLDGEGAGRQSRGCRVVRPWLISHTSPGAQWIQTLLYPAALVFSLESVLFRDCFVCEIKGNYWDRLQCGSGG